MKRIGVGWKYKTAVEISEKLGNIVTIILACHHSKSDTEVVTPLQWNSWVSKQPSEDTRTEKLNMGSPMHTGSLPRLCNKEGKREERPFRDTDVMLECAPQHLLQAELALVTHPSCRQRVGWPFNVSPGRLGGAEVE